MLSGTLGASLLENKLAGQGVVKPGNGIVQEDDTVWTVSTWYVLPKVKLKD